MFGTVETTFYTDAKVRKWDESTKSLAVYFLICQHRNLLGCYILPPGYILVDLGWDEKRLQESLTRLEADGFVSYDRDAQMVCITNYLKYHPIQNKDYLKGAIKVFNALPHSPILGTVQTILSESAVEFGIEFQTPTLHPPDTHPTPTRVRESKGNLNGKGKGEGKGRDSREGKTKTLKPLSNNFISNQSQNPESKSKDSPSELPNPSVSQNPDDAGRLQVKGNGEMPQAVRVYQRLTGITLGLSKWSGMDEIISSKPDALLLWERIVAYWMKQGLDLKRIDLMLEYYVKGIVP